MDAQEVFAHFVAKVLSEDKARRLLALCDSRKGRRKILSGLCHEFGPAILPRVVRKAGGEAFWSSACYVFHEPLGFGVEFASVREAYDRLAVHDGWLIIVRDGSAGIHRPEARWDDEKFIATELARPSKR
jgi:hypothetical protein